MNKASLRQGSNIHSIMEEAVLILPAPPSPHNAEDWYWTRIAGVPFLLRNILTLQRAGLKKIHVFAAGAGSFAGPLNERIRGDARVRVKTEIIDDPATFFKSNSVNENLLVINGSPLIHKNELLEIQGISKNRLPDFLTAVPLNLKNFTDLLNEKKASPGAPTEGSSDAGPALLYLKGEASSQITQLGDFQTQHEKLLKTCGLNNDSLMDRWITRRVSRQITRFFLGAPLTPNQITLLSLAIGFVSAGFFLQGTYLTGLAGALLLLLSAWVDCADGEVARLKFMESNLGGQLDILADNLVHFAVFFSIGYGLHVSRGNSTYLILGCLAVLGSLVSFILLASSIAENKSAAEPPDKLNSGGSNLVDQIANRDFTYFLLLLAIFGRIDFFIALTAIGANIFAIYLVYLKVKKTMQTVNRV